jgi:hypothetical protein
VALLAALAQASPGVMFATSCRALLLVVRSARSLVRLHLGLRRMWVVELLLLLRQVSRSRPPEVPCLVQRGRRWGLSERAEIR